MDVPKKVTKPDKDWVVWGPLLYPHDFFYVIRQKLLAIAIADNLSPYGTFDDHGKKADLLPYWQLLCCNKYDFGCFAKKGKPALDKPSGSFRRHWKEAYLGYFCLGYVTAGSYT